MYQPEPHPDTLLHQAEVKKITRGGRQSADSAAMEAMFDALDSGLGKEEANQIFSQTYQLLIQKNITDVKAI